MAEKKREIQTLIPKKNLRMSISVSLPSKVRDNYIYTILGMTVTMRNDYNKRKLIAMTTGITNITVM
jgi:hypothetical protein